MVHGYMKYTKPTHSKNHVPKERIYYMNNNFTYNRPRYFQRPSKHSKPIAKICTPKEADEAQRMWDALCRASKKRTEGFDDDEK